MYGRAPYDKNMMKCPACGSSKYRKKDYGEICDKCGYIHKAKRF